MSCPARETLELYLAKYCPSVKVVDSAGDVISALAKIRATPVDLVFLDVELPYGNAFDLLERVGEIDFETIFITAYENYALKALNNDATHYILKPVEIDELITAVDKVKRHVQLKKSVGNLDGPMDVKDYLWSAKQEIRFPKYAGFRLGRNRADR